MAILQGFPGLKVQVVVGDLPLREYKDSENLPKANAVSKYIESITDAEFALRVQFGATFPTNRDVVVKISMDGNEIAYDRIAANDLRHPDGCLHDGALVKVGHQTSLQKFKFVPVQSIVERRRLTPEFEDKIAQTGTITVELQHCTNVRKDWLQTAKSQRIAELGEIPESAMKHDPKSHQACLSAPVPKDEQDIEDWDWVGDGPFAKFNFHYRSLEFLQAMWIAPRPAELRGRTEARRSPAETLRPVRKAGKRDARGRQIDRVQQNPSHDSGLGVEDEVNFVSSQPVRKRRLGRSGATLDNAIDVDELLDYEGEAAIKKMVAR